AASGDTLEVDGVAVTAPWLSFTALAGSTPAAAYGQAVTLTATVQANGAGLGTPSGTVDFVDATTDTVLGSAPLVGGSAALTPSALASGEHLIRAVSRGDGNFTLSLDALAQRVTPVTPTVTVSGGTFSYDQTAHEAAATATGVDGSPVTGRFAFSYDGSASAPSRAGTYAVQATFSSADPNYAGATGTAALVITPATPVLTWAAPAAIPSATALDGTQLNATADVPGTFAYSPAAGTFLATGTQQLTVTFTPDDRTDYTPGTRSVQITVNEPPAPTPATGSGGAAAP